MWQQLDTRVPAVEGALQIIKDHHLIVNIAHALGRIHAAILQHDSGLPLELFHLAIYDALRLVQRGQMELVPSQRLLGRLGVSGRVDALLDVLTADLLC